MIARSLTRSLSRLLVGRSIVLDELDEPARRRIRAAQIDAVIQLVPMTASINMLNAAVIDWVFWRGDTAVFLTVWSALVVGVAAAGLLSWSRSRRSRPVGASARATKRFILQAVVLAMIWGAAPLSLFPQSDLMGQLILGCLMAGMISGGAFCLSTVPKAGLAYTWIIVGASASALLLADNRPFIFVAILLVLFAIFLSRNLVSHGILFAGNMRDKLKLEAQGEVIALLLHDFQEDASDWLWQTDATGILLRVSARFADAAGSTASEIQGMPLAAILGNGQAHSGAEPLSIADRMAKRIAFRDVVAPVHVATQRRFWLLSAKPVFDSAGKFMGYRGVGSDVTEKRLAEDRNFYLAHYDTVTKLPNRISFRQKVDRVLAGARERGQSVALLCLDLDQFKLVNDTLGHHVGDALLERVAQRISACVRGRDFVARLGGDEFAILQCYAGEPTVTMMLARQIIDAFHAPFTLDHGEVAISTSIGIAIASADSWETDVLMKKADMALYAAKADGAATYCLFKPEMEALAHRRRALEVGLRSALENGEMQIAYQPFVDLRSGMVAGCEALARWNSPQWGMVSPTEFIPVAEATGLIVPIGEWVLREAIKAARRWPAGTIVSVNLSPAQFRCQTLLATVVSGLADGGIAPHRLELEVTELIFLDGGERTVEMLNNLRALGVRTALDDFGTGYSSLSYLRRFPFDKLKIDKSFIDDIARKDESLAIVRAIVALADALGISTVAEGVETAAQVDRLRSVGCSQIQGFVFARPQPAAGIAAVFDRRIGGEENAGLAGRRVAAVARLN